jgi:hypothetical protein
MRVMTRHYLVIGGVALAVVVAAALLSPRAAKGATGAGLQQCFRSGEITNWVAPDPKTLYLRAAGRYYRVDLARECSPLRWKDAHLITRSHGTGLICSPLDWNLRASEGPGDIAEPCFVQSITRLNPGDVAALPRQARP